MNNLNIYVELQKSVDLTNSSNKIIESIEGNTRTKYKIKGIASTTSIDRDGERVTQNCIKRMVERVNEKKLPIFGNHEHHWENMLGYADKATVEGNSIILDITTAYEETHPKVKQLVGSIQSGLPLMLSIGGKVKMSNKPDGKTNTIEDVDLLETSVVGIGANPDAFISLDEIAKAFKGDEKMDTKVNKSAGQSGEMSYGKLGETTPQARCPKCGQPSELREQTGSATHYHCHPCGINFSVEAETKDTGVAPVTNPSNPQTPKLGEEPKLAMEQKGAEDLDLTKGDEMTDEPISKSAPIVDKCNKEDDEDEEKAYAKFKARYARMKAEGTTTVPGGENAAPKNSINAKSAKDYDSMQKAFVDNAAVEGLDKSVNSEKADFSFKGMRDELIRRK